MKKRPERSECQVPFRSHRREKRETFEKRAVELAKEKGVKIDAKK